VTLNNCTFSSDTVIRGSLGGAGGGGGFYNDGIAKVTNCTFSYDTAKGFTGGYGGGIYNKKPASLVNVTFSNIKATHGPNINLRGRRKPLASGFSSRQGWGGGARAKPRPEGRSRLRGVLSRHPP
jgi:hypothetical protein